MNVKKQHPFSSSSSCSSKIRKPEKTRNPPPVNSLKLVIKFKNSRPYAILPINKCNESRKRKEPEKEIHLGLKSREEIRVAKKLKSFSFYSHQEEQEEKLMGVSTKLELHDDSWCIGVI